MCDVVDGTGAPPFLATAVLIRGDRIEAVGSPSIPRGATIVDGSGLVCSPVGAEAQPASSRSAHTTMRSEAMHEQVESFAMGARLSSRSR